VNLIFTTSLIAAALFMVSFAASTRYNYFNGDNNRSIDDFMVQSYAKGYRAEWSLIHTLAKSGFMVLRAPRSGRIGLPSPDIVAAKDGKLIVIECKSREAAFTIEKEQLAELRAWQEKARAIPYIGWKINRQGWTFLHLKDVEDNNGNIGKKFAAEKGFPLEKIIEM